MTQPQSGQTRRGASILAHPRQVIAVERDPYTQRFGAEFAERVTKGSWALVIGGWVMVIGLIAMIGGGVAAFFATGSLPTVFRDMELAFGVIVVGFIVNNVGIALRSGPIKALSAKIMAFNPKVTPDGARRLIRDPHLYARWMAQHPGFVPD